MRIQNVLITLLVLVLAAPSGSAQTYTWNGGTGSWNDGLKWTSTSGGFPNAPGVVAQFNGTSTATTNQNVAAGVTVGTITLGGSSDAGWLINTANGITLNGGGNGAIISNTNTSSGSANTLDITQAPLTLADNLLVSNTSGSTNTFGAIQLRSVIGGSGNLTFNNASTALTQIGSIRLQTADNAFTGSVLVQRGTVTFNRGLSFGNSSNVITLGQSGQGDAAILLTTGLTVAQNFVIAAGTGGATTIGGTSTSNATYSGNITLNGDLNLLSNTTTNRYTFSGVLSGGGGITKVAGAANAGIVQLTNANTYTGATVVSAGTLQLGANGSINSTSTISVLSGATFDVGSVSGGYSLGGTTAQTLQGTGTVTGATTVASNGTIRGDSGAGTGTLTTGNLTIQSGGQLDVQLGTGTAASRLNSSAGVLNLNTGAIIDPNGTLGGGDRVIANIGSGAGALIVGGTTYDTDATIATYTYASGTGLQAFGALQIDVTDLSLTAGDGFTLRREGNNLVLNFSPVPEPALLLAVCGLAVGGVAAVRRLRRKAQSAEVTPAA